MGQDSTPVRREFLRRVGLGIMGLFAGTAATAGTGSRLFAGQFLKEKHPKQLPEGYYDPDSQLFRASETGRPMFVAEGNEPIQQLSREELLELIENGRFVDVSRNPLFGLQPQFAQTYECTASVQTSYYTTRCCPIVTDTQRDQGCDDTPGLTPG